MNESFFLVLFDRKSFIKPSRNFDQVGPFGRQHVEIRPPMAFRVALDQINVAGIVEVIQIKDVLSRIGVRPVELLRLTVNKFRIDLVGGQQQQETVPIDFGKRASGQWGGTLHPSHPWS